MCAEELGYTQTYGMYEWWQRDQLERKALNLQGLRKAKIEADRKLSKKKTAVSI